MLFSRCPCPTCFPLSLETSVPHLKSPLESKVQNRFKLPAWGALLTCFVSFALFADPVGFSRELDNHATPSMTGKQLLALPMQFEQNAGQVDSQVEFFSRGQGYTLWLTRTRAVLSLRAGNPIAARGNALKTRDQCSQAELEMTLVGANPHACVEGLDRLPSTINYFMGDDPKRWRAGVPAFAKVKYRQVYPGIDLVYYGKQASLEYDFIVSPGVDASRIGLRFKGADRLEINEEGGLVASINGGTVRWEKPIVYQKRGAERVEIPARFILKNHREAGFQVDAYDARRELIIDPVLVYSTYLGGGANDQATSMAVDGNGNVYVAGYTTSLNFPTTNYFKNTSTGSNDVFVTKVNANGTALVYSTYLGGNGNDFADGLAVDTNGNAYITGQTDSPNFPTKNAAYGGNAGFNDAFVTKLGPFGTNLIYSTYLGGGGDDFGRAVAVDSGGNAYVAGKTYSIGNGNSPFPTTQGAFQRDNGGGNTVTPDAFITKFNTNGLVSYSTFLGGHTEEKANGIAVDSAGNAYVVGEVASHPDFPTPPSSDFPLQNAFQPLFNQGNLDPLAGTTDGFLTKLNATGTGLIYSTFLGGNDEDTITGIALDSAGRVHVVGITSSTNFPTLKAAQAVNAGTASDPDFPGPDAFITKFETNGTSLLYSTYLGGSIYEAPFILERFGIAVDKFGDIYVAGQTGSFDFPLTPGADQTNSDAVADAFIAKINPAVPGPASLIYSTILSGSTGTQPGGADNEAGPIAVDSNGNFYIAGVTTATNFPVTAGAFRSTNSGGAYDIFVTKFSSPADLSVTVTPSVEPVVVGSNLTYTIQINNNGRSTFTLITNRVQFPANVQFGAITATSGSFDTNAGGGLVIFNVGSMTNNASVTQTVVITNPSPATNTITAQLTGNESELNTSNNVAAVISTVRGAADVLLAQTSAPNPVTVGSNLVYTVTITNKGFWPASSITVTDTLPAGFQFVSVSPSQFCTTNDAGAVFCTGLGPLAAGSATTVTISVIAATSGPAVNVATATAFELDPLLSNNSATNTTTVNPLADLGIGQTASASSLLGGTLLTNTILITNFGPSAASSVVLTSPLPPGVVFVSATSPQGTATLSNGVVICTFGSIAINGRASVVIAGRPMIVGSLTNTSSITSSATDPNPANNTASLVTTVLPAADLGLTQSATPALTLTSSNLTFTLLISNAGPSTATNVVLSDPLPTPFNLLSVPASCTFSNGVLICNLGNLANGATATINVPVMALTDGISSNTATVSSTGAQATPDAFLNNNTATAVVVVNDFPGSPTLRVAALGNNVILSWSTNSLAARLQTKSSVATNVAWSDVAYSHVAIGNQFKFTNAITGSAKFFRLAQ